MATVNTAAPDFSNLLTLLPQLLSQLKTTVGTNKADTLVGDGLFNFVLGLGGNDSIKTTGLANLVFAGNGNDSVTGDKGIDIFFGDAGNDFLDGGLGNDYLFGGRGNDILEGGKGDDFMDGGSGNDILAWDDGDGSDRMIGGSGYDTIAVEGSLTKGDNFVLGKNSLNQAIFDRIGLDNQTGVGTFRLTVTESEKFDISGEGGNDSLKINDLSYTGVQKVLFDGGAGDDSLDASLSSVKVIANGGTGIDTLIGSAYNDIITGGDGRDNLTGGQGKDTFIYDGNLFANGPLVTTPNGIKALNAPDNISDFSQKQDRFGLDRTAFGLTDIHYAEGNVTDLSGNSNILVLTGTGFVNAAAAAQAIADNNNITADKGAFIYFNTTLGISRLVYSENLSSGGNISVLANLNNITTVNQQVDFSANNFTTIA
jgi:Ca2+-binding RTX toxin-like protein